MESKPTLDLALEQVTCVKHLEPFRTSWPTGFVTFGLELVDNLPDTFEEATEAIAAKPLCEQASQADLLAAYLKSGIGTRARCVWCNKLAEGTPLHTSGPDGEITQWKHICFECLINAPRAN